MTQISSTPRTLAAAVGLAVAFAMSTATAQQTGPSEQPGARGQPDPYQYREGREPSRQTWPDDDDEAEMAERDSDDRRALPERERWGRDNWRDRGRGDERWGRFRDRWDDDRRHRGMPGYGGPGMMGARGLMRLCGPRGDRILAFMLDRMEGATNPTATQLPLFEALRDAAGKAAEAARAACPGERAITPPGRLAAAEKRLEAMLEAIRIVRPALEAFYATLTDEQKARLYVAQAHPWIFRGWRDGRDGRWQEQRTEEGRGEQNDRSGDRGRDGDSDRGRRDWRGGGRMRDYPRDDDLDGWLDEWRGRM